MGEFTEGGIVKLRTTIVGVAMAAAAMFPFAGTAQAYHCYSPEFGDCSAVQHALENLGEQFGGKTCVLIHKVTGGQGDC